MAKDKSVEDTISEEEYTIQMKSASTSPADDSPGDSESDARSEFQMGLNYVPDESNDPEEFVEDSSPNVIRGELLPFKEKSHPIVEIPETATVVFSDIPSHRMDRDTPSDTH